MRIVVLTRNSRQLVLRGISDIELVEADIRSISSLGTFDIVIHSATSSVRVGEEDAASNVISRIVDGTEAILELLSGKGTRLLFLSSGAIYGPQIAPVSELSRTGPDPMDQRTAYAQGKHLPETLCAAASEAGEVSAVIARLFVFVGPRIPLDAHFAAGNFLRDVLEKKQIIVQGDGQTRRFYLCTGDFSEWCWALLARGVSEHAYNVGSPVSVTIAELAGQVAMLTDPLTEVQILGRSLNAQPSWYVPSTAKPESELGLQPRVGLDEALRRTFSWLQSQRSK